MQNLENYLKNCLKKGGVERSFLLQCENSTGDAEQKLAYKILLAAKVEGDHPVVVWFGNGFSDEVVENCQWLADRLGVILMSAGEFAQMALAGKL
jgi:hypothetical protein